MYNESDGTYDMDVYVVDYKGAEHIMPINSVLEGRPFLMKEEQVESAAASQGAGMPVIQGLVFRSGLEDQLDFDGYCNEIVFKYTKVVTVPADTMQAAVEYGEKERKKNSQEALRRLMEDMGFSEEI